MDIPSSRVCVCEWCAGPVMRIKSSLTSVVELGAPKSPASCLAEICERAFLVKRHPRPLNCRLHIHCHIMAHLGKRERARDKVKKKEAEKNSAHAEIYCNSKKPLEKDCAVHNDSAPCFNWTAHWPECMIILFHVKWPSGWFVDDLSFGLREHTIKARLGSRWPKSGAVSGLLSIA